MVGTDTKYIQLLPQSYVRVVGDRANNIPSKRYAVYKPRCTTWPLEVFPWACGSTSGKLDMVAYVCKEMEYFREREECLVCVLDWDTWRTMVRVLFDKHGRGVSLSPNLCLVLDHFHQLKYLTHSCVELCSPIRNLMMGILGVDRADIEVEGSRFALAKRSMVSLKGQQTFVMVWWLAYMKVRGEWVAILNAKQGEDCFVRYLTDLFEVAIQLCVGGWVAYRLGWQDLFGQVMVAAVPLLYCMHHPKYAAGVLVNNSWEWNGLRFCKHWLTENWRLLQAEVCEMTLKPLSSMVRRDCSMVGDVARLKRQYIFQNYCRDTDKAFHIIQHKDVRVTTAQNSKWNHVIVEDDVRVLRAEAWLRDLLWVCCKRPSTLKLSSELRNYPGWTCMRKQTLSKVSASLTKWFGDTLPGGPQFAAASESPDCLKDVEDPDMRRLYKRAAEDGRNGSLQWQIRFKRFCRDSAQTEPDLDFFSDFPACWEFPHKQKLNLKAMNLWTGTMRLDKTSQDVSSLAAPSQLSRPDSNRAYRDFEEVVVSSADEADDDVLDSDSDSDSVDEDEWIEAEE